MNDKKVNTDVAAFMSDDTVLVLVRVIFGAIGAEVEWIEENSTVFSRLGGSIITMQI